MVWVKFDDHFTENPKIVDLSDAAYRLYTTAITYANRELTDGYVPEAKITTFMVLKRPKLATEELVKAGLWHPAAEPCGKCVSVRADAGLGAPQFMRGYLIHDYLEYQPARAGVEETRAARARAGRRGGLRSTERRSSGAEATGQASAQAEPA